MSQPAIAAPALPLRDELDHLLLEALHTAQIDLDALLAGRIEPWHLPAPIRDLYWIAFWAGQAAMRPTIDEARMDAERAWQLVGDDRRRMGQRLLAAERINAHRKATAA